MNTMSRRRATLRPRLPPKVIGKIISYLLPELQGDVEARAMCKATLYACTLVSRFWNALAMPWLFYDLSYVPKTKERRRRTGRSVFTSTYASDADLLTLHDDLKWSPNLQRYVRRLRLGDRGASGTQFLRLSPSCLDDVVHLIPRLEALVLRCIMMRSERRSDYMPERSLECLWLTSDGEQSWKVADLQAALGAISLFTSLRELRLSVQLNDARTVPQESDSEDGRIISPPRLTPVESIVVKCLDTLPSKWPHSYRELSRILGSVVPLQDTRSVSIVNFINEGVLGLLHGDLERLRWSFCLGGQLCGAPGAFFNQKLPKIPPCKGLREVTFGLRIQQGTRVLSHIVTQIVMNVLNAVCTASNAIARGLREVIFEMTFDEVDEWDMHLPSHAFRDVDRKLVRVSELCVELDAVHVEYDVIGERLPAEEYEKAVTRWFPGACEKGKLQIRTKTANRW